MFRLINLTNGEIYDTDAPLFVKKNSNTGSWIKCHEDDAECIVINNTLYNISGKPPSISAQDTVAIMASDFDLWAAIQNITKEIEKITIDVQKLNDKVFGDGRAG